jgi:MSHA biogenesis protein MshJ
MKKRINRIAAKVNALSVRERFLLFAVIVSLLGALTDTFFISPLMEQQKALVAQLDRKSTDMDALREKVNAEVLKRNLGRAAELTTGLAATREELAAVEREIAALFASSSDPVAMSALLGRVLKRSDKVALVRVVQANADAVGTTQSAARGAVDITLSGQYLDLVEYLAALEKALPQARWSAVRLKADASPTQVTVRIVTGADA